MSEWIGWVSRLRRTIYARLEDLSFRTGAATVTGVLAVAATAIVLTITQGGHHAAPRSVFAGAVPSSLVVAPPMSGFAPSATRSARHSHAAAPFAGYVPQPSPTRTRTRQAAPSPSRPAPWHPSWAASSPGPGWPYPSPSPFPWPPG